MLPATRATTTTARARWPAAAAAAAAAAQDYLEFLGNLSDSLRRDHGGGRLFGNAMFMLPHIQFATAFSIAGIETGWDPVHQTPGTPWYMRFVRAMSAAKPYLYLMVGSIDHRRHNLPASSLWPAYDT